MMKNEFDLLKPGDVVKIKNRLATMLTTPQFGPDGKYLYATFRYTDTGRKVTKRNRQVTGKYIEPVKPSFTFHPTPATPTESKYQVYHCSRCGHEVSSTQKPDPIKWTDGHTCIFILGEGF